MIYTKFFKPDLGGSWVNYNGGTFAPTISPAPTHDGGCKDPRNHHLDKCFRENHQAKASAAVWDSLGPVGQVSVFLISFMSATLAISIFLARARRRRRRGESYLGFFIRDMSRKKRKKKLRKKIVPRHSDLSEEILGSDSLGKYEPAPPARAGRSSSSRSRSRSKSKTKHRHRSTSRSDRDGDESRRSKNNSRRSSRSRSRSRSRSISKSRSKRDKDEGSKLPKKQDSRRQLV